MRTRPIAIALVLGFLAVALLATAPTASAEGTEWPDYVEYREKGFVIGSGMMESTCKQLVGQRLKGSGRQWSEPGAVAMAALIGQRPNRSWDAFWRSRPLQRAA